MLKRHVVIVRALVVLAVVTILGMAWSAPVPYRVDIGRFDAAVVQGFYDPEFGSGTTFRWSQPQATLTLAGVGAGAYQLDIHATAPAGTVVTVTVADNPPQTLQLNTGFVRYSLPHTIVVPWQWPPQPLRKCEARGHGGKGQADGGEGGGEDEAGGGRMEAGRGSGREEGGGEAVCLEY